MIVMSGMLVQIVNAVILADGLLRYGDCSVDGDLYYQLYDDNGKERRGEYHGIGSIVERDGVRFAILGDPYRSTQLPEYRIAQTPTAESSVRLDRLVAGVRAAIGNYKIGRRVKKRGTDWLRGYDEALAQRKVIDRTVGA